jgi:uncharacterized protein YegP (UPF0339 family)
MPAKFEIFKDVINQYRFRLRAPNGEPILQSEGYTTKQSCKDTVNAIKAHASQAEIVDLTGERTYY